MSFDAFESGILDAKLPREKLMKKKGGSLEFWF